MTNKLLTISSYFTGFSISSYESLSDKVRESKN